MKNGFGTIVQIGKILVSEEVVTDFFCCDYSLCKGQCCITGDSGAPLEENELQKLEKYYPEYSPLMSEKGRAAVDGKGFFEIDIEGDMVTPLVNGSMECAYAHFDECGNCMCSIEKCHDAGLCDFQKPKSCILYPIRVTELTGGGLALNMHHWDICSDARRKGQREGIRAYQFLKKPLTVFFGDEFYESLEAAAKLILQDD